MYLDQILKEVKDHQRKNWISKKRSALNIPDKNFPHGRLVNMTDDSTIKMLVLGSHGKISYRYWIPVVETINNKKECTYVIYG